MSKIFHLTLTAFALLFANLAAHAAPANDAFGAARVISNNTGTTTGTNVGATFQPDDEP